MSSECKRYEDFDLKNVRNLKNYDCWDEDLTPEEWEAKCKLIGKEKPHAQVPIYQNGKYV